MLMTHSYDTAKTAFVLVDPYNDFFAEDGKIYPRLKEVAESVGLHQHVRELLAASRAAGIQFVIAPAPPLAPGRLRGLAAAGAPASVDPGRLAADLVGGWLDGRDRYCLAGVSGAAPAVGQR
jgi:hypothetical protein